MHEDVRGRRKSGFVHDFIPGIPPSGITHLSYAKTGGIDPTFIAVATMNSQALKALRRGSKLLESRFVIHCGDPFGISNEERIRLQKAVRWWLVDQRGEYEVRRIWMSSRMSTFLIPQTGNTVYINADEF